MKKIILAVIAFVGITINSYGQTKPQKKITATTVTQTTSNTGSKAAPIKSDGTLDMRYKANKKAAKTLPKLKKDGTPDMRFTRNKKRQ